MVDFQDYEDDYAYEVEEISDVPEPNSNLGVFMNIEDPLVSKVQEFFIKSRPDDPVELDPLYVKEVLEESHYNLDAAIAIILDEMNAYYEPPVEETGSKLASALDGYAKTSPQHTNGPMISLEELQRGFSEKVNLFDFKEPSPDDLVRVQKKTVKIKEHHPIQHKQNRKTKPKPVETLEDRSFSVKKLRQVQKQKQKLLQSVKKAEKQHINLIFAGHVDSGKSTISGHLLYLLGRVSNRNIAQNERDADIIGKSSFKFAWVMDAHETERTRGVTVDVGFNYFETEHRDVTLLDAPGHRDFVPNMIGGAVQADAAVLVIEASIGGFEKAFEDGGQTKEHAILLKSLGVHRVIVAVNKMDMVGWDHERFDVISRKVGKFLLKTGFKEKNIVCIPCSGLLGDNILKRSENLPWFEGQVLVEAIDRIKAPSRDVDSAFRMTVSDIYKSSGLGITVGGTISSGALITGEQLYLMPLKQGVTVKGIQNMQREKLSIALAGDNVEVGIAGVEEIENISVGNVLCDAENCIQVSQRFQAKIVILSTELPIIKGEEVVLFLQHLNLDAYITDLISFVDQTDGTISKKKPRFLIASQSALVLIETALPICIETFQASRDFGRILLRRNGETIAVGIVSEILPSVP